MIFSFDLISDIHRETWDNFDWEGQPTAPYCVVAGDIARDRALVIDTLEQLGEAYSAVFYIDGNDEHKDYSAYLTQSYRELRELIKNVPNVIYIQDNVIIINGVALLATNGWWTYDFDMNLDLQQSLEWLKSKENIMASSAGNYTIEAFNDAAYLINSVQRLQTQNDVKAIVLITHTVPNVKIIQHDLELIDTWRFNSMGNSHLTTVLDHDTENKIKTWCFGHYHRSVDRVIDGIRYVSNPRGKGNTEYSQVAYYPKRISVQY